MKKSNSNFYIIFCILIIAGCFYASWKMLIPKYQTASSSITQLNSEISSAREKLESLKTAKLSLEELGPLVSQSLVAVPKDTDVPNLITELEALATKNSLVIPSIQITKAGETTAPTASATTISATPDSTDKIPISFAVSGDFNQLSQFLASLERDLKYMNVNSLTLSAGEKGMSLSLQLEAYKRAETSLASTAPSRSLPSAADTGIDR